MHSVDPWSKAADLIDPPVTPGITRWRDVARPKQLAPLGLWFLWIVLAGRGFGKSRCGGEWLNERVVTNQTSQQVLVAGRTPADVRDYALYGDGGLLTHHPEIEYEPSKRLLTWPNGVRGLIRSGANPEEFRGYSGNTAWLDEFCAWDYPEEAWYNLAFGIRASNPRVCITTTPKPLKILMELMKRASTISVRGSSYDNKANLSPEWFDAVIEPTAGTRLGRQEVEAEILEDVEGALWTLQAIEDLRVKPGDVPQLKRIAIGVDPQGKKGEGKETGIVAVGRGINDHIYVIEDGSINGTPGEWAARAVAVFDRKQADLIVGEVNYGGEMVEHTVRTVRKEIPFHMVHATRGKQRRAQPVAALYEQFRGHHVGRFSALEDEMVTFTDEARWSPNRMDGLVWATYAVMPELGAPEPPKKRRALWGSDPSR